MIHPSIIHYFVMMSSMLMAWFMPMPGAAVDGETEAGYSAAGQYYFGELKLDPERPYYHPDEEITIYYTNRGFDSVWIIGRGLQKRRGNEWVTVRLTDRRVIRPPSPRRTRPFRGQEIPPGNDFTYTFPTDRLRELDKEVRGTYRYMLRLTSRPNEPDYAVIYREFSIR